MKKLTVLWMGLLVGAFGSSAFAADSQKVVDVKTVQGWIAEKHAHWRAKESWVTQLSRKEIQTMLGLKKLPEGQLDFEAAPSGKRSALSLIDWRNNNGVNWIGPVMNQGNCGSCVAFATVATLEAQHSIAAGIPWLHPTFSSQALFACGGGGCETGWMPDEASSYLESDGIPDEACLPYTSGSTGNDVSCSQICGDAASRSLKIQSTSSPSSFGGNAEEVKAALKNGPLVTTLTVYEDFLAYGGGVYRHVSGKIAGGHAVSLVGFDDSKRAWLIRNSWGTEWGENGFGWISFDDPSGVAANTWGFEIPPSNGYLSVTTPLDREYVSGALLLTAQAKGLPAQDIQFHLRDSTGHEVVKLSCAAQSGMGCSASLDTSQLTEGRYEILATGSVSQRQSQVREFFIINSEPKMSLAFGPVEGESLNGPLNGRPEFLVKAVSSPVPIQHVEFRAIDSHGKVAAIKGNDNVLEDMKMGWRTITVPNGQYKILFHGETRYLGKTYAVDSNFFTITVKN